MTFKKYSFTQSQIKKYFTASQNDFKAAKSLSINDIQFRIAYDALLKMAIALCAEEGLRVDSKTGHHKELIDKLSVILKRSDVEVIGNKMRKKRNFDLYSGGLNIPEKDIKNFIAWLDEIFIEAENYIQNKKGQKRMI